MKNYRQQFNWKELMLAVLLAVLPSFATQQLLARSYISEVSVAGGENTSVYGINNKDVLNDENPSGEGLNYVLTTNLFDKAINYALTSFKPTTNTKVQFAFRINSMGKGVLPVFGSAGSAGLDGNDIFALWVNGDDCSFGYATGSKAHKSGSNIVKEGVDYYVTLQDGKVEISTGDNGDTHLYHDEIAVYPFHENATPLAFGKINGSDTATAKLSLYFLNIWEKNELVCEMVPASGTNGIGFFDKYSQKYVMSAVASSNGNKFFGMVSDCADGKHFGFEVDKSDQRRCLICGKGDGKDVYVEPYIKFNGTSFFDSGYVPTNNTEIRMHFVHQLPEGSSVDVQDFFGIGDQYPKMEFSFVDRTNSMTVLYPQMERASNGNFVTVCNHGLMANQEYYLTMNMNGVKVARDAEYNELVMEAEFNSASYVVQSKLLTLLVGAANWPAANSYVTKPGVNFANFKLFSFEIYEDGMLVHNFIPDSQFGKFGFYDSVDGTFHSMLGEGATSKMDMKDESNINNMKKLYYITNVSTTNNTRYDVRFKINNFNPTADAKSNNIFGCVFYNNQGKIERQITAAFHKGNGGANMLYLITRSRRPTGELYQNNYETNFALELGEVYTLKIRRSSDEVHVDVYKGDDTKLALNYSQKIDEFELGWNVGEASGGANKLILFNDQALDNDFIADMTLYKFDIYEGDNLIRRYLPYKHISDNSTYAGYPAVPWMFDAMTEDFLKPYYRNCLSVEGMVNIFPCAEHKYSEAIGETTDGLKYKCKVCGTEFTKTRNYLVLANSKLDTGILPTANTNVRMGYKTPDFKSSGSFVHLFGQDNGSGYTSDSYYLELVKKEKDATYGWNSEMEGYRIHSNTDEYISFWHDKALIYDSPEMETPIFAFSRKDYDYQGGNANAKKLELPGIFDKQTQATSTYMLYFMDIYDKDGDGNDTCLRKYVPARNGEYFGLFDIVNQKFVQPTQSKKDGNATGVVNVCDEHEYLDIVQKGDVWQKHCRVCDYTIDMTPEELGGGAFIRTNGSSAFISKDKKVTIGEIDYKTNTDVRMTPYYNGEDLEHCYYPSRFEGNISMYDAVTGNIEEFTGEGMSCYIPECKYHKYYKVENGADGNIVKHCYLCDAKVPLNTINVESKKILMDLASKTDTDTHTHIIYIDMGRDDKHEQHVGTNYPTVDKSTSIYEYAIMQEGALKHYFVPGVFNEENGVYDVVTDNFIYVPGSEVHVNKSVCNHTYKTTTYSDGNVNDHCYICDKKFPGGCYMDITFDANGAKAGIMGVQRIEGEGKVNANLFKKDLCVFDGWVIKKDGKIIGNLVKDEGYVQVNEDMKGDVTFEAQWKGAFSYNGSVFAIDEKNTVNIDIVDDGENGFFTAEEFVGNQFSYKREITPGVRYGTLCLPFAISTNENSDFTLYVPQSVSSVTNGSTTIHMEKVDAVAAGEPCVFYLKDNLKTLYITHVVTDTQNDKVRASASTNKSNDGLVVLNGAYELQVVNVGNDKEFAYYAVQDDVFYRVASTLTVRPYHAYITTSKTTTTTNEAPERYFLSFDDDNATSVIVVEGSELLDLDSVEYFSLSGMRLNAPQKGINIVKMKNGETRKIVF